MFENACGEEGLDYMRSYVQTQCEAGASGSELLASFGVAPSDAPPAALASPPDMSALSTTLLQRVQAVQDSQLSRELAEAAREGRTAEAVDLLSAGAAWDAIDEAGHSAGAYALRRGDARLLRALCEAGSRCVLSEAERRGTGGEGGGERGASEFDGEHARFLCDRLRYERGGVESSLSESDRLMDTQARPVMMAWEAPLMAAHARAIVPRAGEGVVINIGFGMGLVDRAIAERRPSAHHIIEAHPDVYRQMQKEGWAERAVIHFGSWQDVLPRLCEGLGVKGVRFDGLMFDTFA
ncbi:MAG: hypothetical protein SGPRY_012023, partial [Prymnesium sp.]